MKNILGTDLFLLLISLFAYAQSGQSQTSPADMLGMTCSQILAKGSSAWMNAYSGSKSDGTPWIEQGLAIFGDCYDKRTDDLAASLTKSGKGPLMGGLGNLQDMQTDLQNFTTQALAATASDGTYSRIRAAYAMLYQKQFRYLFYAGYMSPDTEVPVASDPQQLNQAKERLGELISQYKGKQGENLQDAFDTFRTSAIEGCGIPELQVYEYAISILQSPSDPPFSRPPF
jgi:hypothetical protein